MVQVNHPAKPGLQTNTIIWDWNGTLLNDAAICVESINILLKERGLPLITPDRYRQLFTFPVINYYKALGFDFVKENFEVPALAFMAVYIANVRQAKLHEDAIQTLDTLKNKGIRQVMLSAMEQKLLDELLDHYKLAPYFEAAYGIEDHFGGGKTHRGLQLVNTLGLDPVKCLFVGDTLHDAEVAEAIGCSHVLLSNGHQSPERLKSNGSLVFGSLSELLGLF